MVHSQLTEVHTVGALHGRDFERVGGGLFLFIPFSAFFERIVVLDLPLSGILVELGVNWNVVEPLAVTSDNLSTMATHSHTSLALGQTFYTWVYIFTPRVHDYLFHVLRIIVLIKITISIRTWLQKTRWGILILNHLFECRIISKVDCLLQLIDARIQSVISRYALSKLLEHIIVIIFYHL